MATLENRDHIHGAGFVDAPERARIAEAVALARGGAADPAEVQAVIDWVARARLEYIMAEGVLDGSWVVRIDNGIPAFRRRIPLDPPVQ